jgi:TolB-like protein/DNA-binding winged helix-turn-helix (wHTH) protein/tetratricopeptide (TPR) repeat protein
VEAAPRKTRIIKFGVFEVDLEAGELRKSGVRQKLAGQPFQILQVFLEHPQEIVTREQLQKRIWPDETVVDYDLALKKAVNRIREVLGDSAESPRFIETIPRRGYRFIAPVAVSDGGDGAPEISNVAPAMRRLQWWLIAAGVVALVVTAFFAVRAFRVRDRVQATSTPQVHSLAVLPLQNLSADSAQEYFSDGMTDALITDLAQIGSVRVISRTSSMAYKKTNKSLPEIAHELNVDGIVEGTVQRSGNRVRITAQLIHAPEDKHLWAKSYERDLRDVFTLEQEVTGDIARQVQAEIATHGQSPVQPRPLDQAILDAYLQGNYYLNKETGKQDERLKKAGDFFQQVIDAEPNFAPAYLGLAQAHHSRWWPSNEDFRIMQASAAKAAELAPTSSDAHGTVAGIKFEDWDWTGAEQEFRTAIGLNPNNAGAHGGLAVTLAAMGQMDEAWKECEIAQQLDPLQDDTSYILYLRGEYDRSIVQVQRMAETSPDVAYVHYYLSHAYEQKGMYAEAVQELGKSMTLFGFPEVSVRLNHAFATSGWRGAMRQWTKELEQLITSKQGYFPGVLADAYTQLGEKDRAFYWLEDGSKHRHLAMADPILIFVKVEPSFTPLRSDPRFNDLLRHFGLAS